MRLAIKKTKSALKYNKISNNTKKNILNDNAKK